MNQVLVQVLSPRRYPFELLSSASFYPSVSGVVGVLVATFYTMGKVALSGYVLSTELSLAFSLDMRGSFSTDMCRSL